MLDVELDECAGKLLAFPRRRGLAGAEPYDRIVQPDRLARLDPDVARDPVTLVEDAKNRNAVGHRRDVGLLPGRGGGAGQGGAILLRILLLATAAGRQKEQRNGGDGEGLHAQSGVQGW